MASATSKAKKLAASVRLPGGQAIAEELSGTLLSNLQSTPDRFIPPTSDISTTSKGTLQNLLTSPQRSTDLGSLSFLQPKEVEPADLTLSQGEVDRRNRLTGELTQRVRDASSARGLNLGEAGAEIEGRTLGRFFQDLSAQDFAKERALTAENIALEQLRQQGATTLFNQEVQLEALRQGQESQLFNQQLAVIQTALGQANIEFTQEQTEFATNLAAAGLPISAAFQFLQLAQAGDLAAAELILTGIGIDQDARNALIGAVGGFAQGVGQAAGTIAGIKLGGLK